MTRTVELDDLAISPDGSKAIFSRSDLNETGDRRETTLWLLDVDCRTSQRLLGTDTEDSNPAWSPDSSRIAFLRPVDGTAQIHTISAGGGPVRVLTTLEGGVKDFHWSPNGSQIAFVSALQPDQPPPGVHIVTRADQNTFADIEGISQIWVLDLEKECDEQGQPRRLTNSATSTTLSFWSNDETTIFYTTNDTLEPYYGNTKSSLRSVNVVDGVEQLARILTTPETGDNLDSAPTLLFSPDGSRVAFTLGNPTAPSEFAIDRLFVMDLATGIADDVTTNYDREVGADGFQWLDKHRLIAINNDSGNANIIKIDVRDHSVKPWWTGERVVHNFSIVPHGTRVLAIASDFVSPPEIYDVSDPENAKILTSVNEFLQKEIILTRPEVISYEGPSGVMIHGYLHKPPNFNADLTYPMIVLCHGGGLIVIGTARTVQTSRL